MERREYDTIREVEDSHWWYQGLWELTQRWLASAVPAASGCRLLDAGCGTGGLMSRLLPGYPGTVGLDLSEDAMRHCRQRGLLRVARASVESLPLPPKCFDAIVSNDVLYHRTAHEAPALEEFHRVLKPGGALLMNLPALESMRGTHDVVVHTRRRFAKPELVRLLSSAGFEPVRVTYRNCFLFPVAWLVRKLRRPVPGEVPEKSDVELPGPLVNQTLLAILRVENLLLDSLDLPFGLSVFCLARKR
ncbi:MAG: class I SAM-dependent methyltransferase [Candidatus Wallbacteria bacterium]|nr:class I SAM-dependent methyltransferase [Candidatus Wallbacteria bacterium]